MGGKNRNSGKGFTIIEVVLFLGITGLLALALLGGWTTMINTQRYKDSTKSFQAFLQEQYNLVYNVQNGRDNPDLNCTVSGGAPVINDDGSGTTTPRGQSGCVMMGRMIHLTGGSRATVYAIIGVDSQSGDSETDAEAILARNPIVVQQDIGLSERTFVIPWQAGLVDGSGNQLNKTITIIRSPLRGSVHTYTTTPSGDTLPELNADLVSPANEAEVNMCLDPGTVFAGERTGVLIQANASGQSAVQTITDGGARC